jgi:HPt (histidine-containing phosphotransfer) domain-containing protein
MVDHELNELRREFLTEARQKAVEMQSAAGESDGAGGLERVAYLAHQLKGSGGSYGYPSISDDAAEIERIVEHADGTVTDGIQGTIREQVERLLAEIDRCAAELA